MNSSKINPSKPIMLPENIKRQNEEIEALSSIYEDDWNSDSDVTRTFKIRVAEHKQEALLFVTMPPEYPSHSPPKYEISAPWMDRKTKVSLHQALNHVYLEHIGESVVFQWVEKVREIVRSIKPEKRNKKKEQKQPGSRNTREAVPPHCPEIIHGDVIIDRKSIFQGHAAEVHSVEEVKAVLSKLKENKKIQNAKHNMFAYRIERETERGSIIIQDFDEDGEAHAGGRMMKLMQVLDQRNTLVIVTRWFGGIQIGADRFRHINNASKQAIEQAGLLRK